MGATIMHGAHDVRVENVSDARLIEPTDALVRITRACICGSDLWPYNFMEPSAMGNRTGGAAPKHWHSATASKAMTHIAIQEALDGKSVDWMK